MSRALWVVVVAGWSWLQGFAEEPMVNLALPEWGGIPSAISTAPDMSLSAQKAADGRSDTSWISGAGNAPVWLRCEWRTPAEIHRCVLVPLPELPRRKTGPLGRFALEALNAGRWEAMASGDGSKTAPGAEFEVRLARPCRTTALRLLLETTDALPLGLSEWRILGPKPVRPVQWAPAWQGAWIWSEPSLVMPNRQPIRRYLRRRFVLDKSQEIRKAWLIACAYDRLCGVWLNNRPVMSDISYSGGLLREAKIAEIAPSMLVAGENVLAAAVDDVYECGSRGLLAELILVDQHGRRTTVSTDSQWKAQEDQGRVPDWRRPGFDDAAWTACRVVAGANARGHGLYGVPYPVVAPEETLEVVELDAAGPVRPGGETVCRVTFECRAVPRADYAIGLRLGQHSLACDHDFELGGAVLRPQEVKTSRWKAGRQTVALRVWIPEESPNPLPATLLVSLPLSGVGLTTRLPGCRVDAYGLHFSIPVVRGARSPSAQSGFSRNEVRIVGGTPTLCIDGRPTSPVLWSSAYGNCRRYSAYAATGVKLFRPLVAGSPICAPGDEARYYPWWLAQVDRMIETALAIDPEIRVLPAVFMDPNPEVLFADPSEQMVTGRGQSLIPNLLSYPDRAQVRPTFMSRGWRQRGAEGLKRLVEHMRSRPYASRVLGVWMFAGRGGENYYGGNELNLFVDEAGHYDAVPRSRWDAGDFSAAARGTFREFLVNKYASDSALEAAWRRPGIRLDHILDPARFRREEICNVLVGLNLKSPGSLRDPREPGIGTLPMDYYQCFAEAMVDTFAAWGRAVKEASDHRLLTGCYYGYALAHLFTHVPGCYGHTAVARACRTPDLDLFGSPSEYDENRRAGGHFWGHNTIDSLRLHGKLWIYEQDSRTFLAEIMPKTFSQAETLEVFKRDAAAGLTRGAGWWWYEFAAGQSGAGSREWFDDPELAAFVRHIKRVYDFALTLPDRGPSAQIAVFYHGETHTAQDIFPPTLPLNVSIGRLTLLEGMQRIGAPFDLYNLADLPELARRGMLAQYRMCLMLNPFYLTGEERRWLDLCKGDGRTVVWLWAPGLAQVGKHPLADDVAEVLGMRGVRLLDELREPTCRLTSRSHPLCEGLPADLELAPRPFRSGSEWERFGNKIAPIPYVAPEASEARTQILGYWVEDGRVRTDRAAFCVCDRRAPGGRGWASVYSAVPYLTPELMGNVARFAGVHIWRNARDVLYADRHFVAIHTGSQPARDVLCLPAKSRVYDVFAKRPLAAAADRVKLDVPAYATALYYLGDPAPFRAAVEKDE